MQAYKPTFVENISLGKGGFFLYDFSADDLNGNRVWYIFAISKAKHQQFVIDSNTEGKSIDLNAYGKILASGFGTAATPAAWENLRAQYGIIKKAATA